MAAATQVPLVDYLVLGDDPHLVATKCDGCGATYFDRRNFCAGCEGDAFSKVDVPTDGVLRTFTIVAHAAPGVPTPFVAGVIDCGDIPVRGNVVNCPPDPEHVSTGMKLRLVTVPIGTDDEGTEAVGYGFEPIS